MQFRPTIIKREKMKQNTMPVIKGAISENFWTVEESRSILIWDYFVCICLSCLSNLVLALKVLTKHFNTNTMST